MRPDREVRDEISAGDPEGGRRPPTWLTRGLAGLAVAALLLAAGRELVSTGAGEPDTRPSPAPTDVAAARPHDPVYAMSAFLAGELDGRLVVELPRGGLTRGPPLEGAAADAGTPRLVDGLPGRWLLAGDRRLRAVPADLDGRTRSLRLPGRALPCYQSNVCAVAPDGRVALVQVRSGRVVDRLAARPAAYRKGGWRPRAVLDDDTLVLTRRQTGDARAGPGGEGHDVAVVTPWDQHLNVLARNARLLVADRQMVVTANRAGSADPLLTTHMVQTGGPTVSLAAKPPKGWTFVAAPATTVDTFRALAYVERDGRRALSVLDPHGDRAPLVRGSYGAGPARGLAKVQASGSLVLGVVKDGRDRFAVWHGDPANPARLLQHTPPPGFDLLGAQFPRPDHRPPPEGRDSPGEKDWYAAPR